MEVDTQRLQQAIRDFKFYARPSCATCGSPATVDDVNKVIDRMAKALSVFAEELEKLG